MQNIEKVKSKFKSLLKEDLRTAIQVIKESVRHESTFFDDLIMYNSNISRLNRDFHIQTISYDEYSLGVNKIRKGVLDVINSLRTEDFKKEENLIDNQYGKPETGKKENPFESIGYGEFKGKNGEFKLTIKPTVLFSYRLAEAFPGIRGVKWFEGNKALKRLSLLLREPTSFDIADGYGLYEDPIWWFRGRSGTLVENFKILPHGMGLLNHHELQVKKVAAYNSPHYHRCFVYVEVGAEQPIGLYNYSEGYIEERVEWQGYFDEAYALFDGIPIRYEEFCDGAAEINGEVIKTSGAEFRVRYLTNYNFILAPKSSPLNSQEGEALGAEYMDGILKGEKSLEEFIERSERLEKNRMDC
jgi:hypothetical protein